MKKLLLSILAFIIVVLIVSGDIDTMYSVFPMWIICYVFFDKIKTQVNKHHLSYSFILVATILGLLTEFFAILSNVSTPYGQRILLHQNLFLDFMFGIVYYSFFMVIMYFIIKRYNFSKLNVFLIFGIFGIMTEEVGMVFVKIFTQFPVGLIYAFIVSFVYGIFPYLAYSLTKHKFDKLQRIIPTWKSYLLIALILMVSFGFYGLMIYNNMIIIFPE